PAEHRLCIELVRSANTRGEGVRIKGHELAIAAAGARTGIHHPTQEASRVRVGSGWAETVHPRMEFAEGLLQVPSQTIVQRELASELPRILEKQCNRIAPEKNGLTVAGGDVVELTEQEAGPGGADAGSAGERLTVKRLRDFGA